MTTIQGNTVPQSLLDSVNGKRAADKSVAAGAQDRFMTLLVTQMKNQDPLNPLDNAQVTSQLAQLSTVTGIEKMNSTLESLIGSFNSAQSLQAANIIGHGVLVPGAALDVKEGKALMGVDLPGPADSVQLTIRDAAGNLVRRMNLGPQETGTLPLAWDVKNDDGAAVGDGRYQMEVLAQQGGQKLDAKPLSFGEVLSVSTGAQGVKLNVSGLGALTMADVRQIL